MVGLHERQWWGVGGYGIILCSVIKSKGKMKKKKVSQLFIIQYSIPDFNLSADKKKKKTMISKGLIDTNCIEYCQYYLLNKPMTLTDNSFHFHAYN